MTPTSGRIPTEALVDGQWLTSSGTFETRDPARDHVIATVSSTPPELVDRAVASAREAFEAWRAVPPVDRGEILMAIAQALTGRSEEIARLISLDSGKPIAQARRDVQSAARHFIFYAGAVDKFGGRELPLDTDHVTYTRWEPRGVTGHITPWNSPLSIPCRSIAAALAMGNSVVVKPSELAPLPVLALAELFDEADRVPPGVFNVIPGLGATTGAALASHPDIDSLTFTGSVSTGAAVMKAAAETITPVSLELGGKAPQLVLDDADLDKAAAGCVFGIIRNAGQSCLAGSRILVHASRYESFVDALVSRFQEIQIGPGIEDPDMGPLISKDKRDQILRQLESVEGTVKTGGGIPDVAPEYADGYFIEPTIVTDIDPEDPVAAEELFAPVMSVQTFESLDDALDRANDTSYGLSAGVWTSNLSKAHHAANELRVGSVSINEYPVRFYNGPHGGYKQSGIGREQGIEALLNYIEIKKIGIRL